MSKKRSDTAPLEINETPTGQHVTADPLNCDAKPATTDAQAQEAMAGSPEYNVRTCNDIHHGKLPIPTGKVKQVESKADRFLRLANRRVPRALKAIQHVANLASKQSYDYTPEQAGKLCGALAYALADLRRRFEGGSGAVETWQL